MKESIIDFFSSNIMVLGQDIWAPNFLDQCEGRIKLQEEGGQTKQILNTFLLYSLGGWHWISFIEHIRECCLDIYLSCFKIEMCHNRQEHCDGLEYGYQRKGLLIVQARFLTITLYYKPSFIHLNFSIYSFLSHVDPLAPYGFYPFRCFYKFPNFY